MDDNSEERDTGLQPVGTPEELEEALKWLEELTARQGKPTELSNPVPSASIDSPFRGLIEGDEGDLPDWLREVPKTTGATGLEESEPESRLDWLAKMAQRESIEELPTLEWRRLAEPIQNSILADQQIELPSEEIEETTEDLIAPLTSELSIEEHENFLPAEGISADIETTEFTASEIAAFVAEPEPSESSSSVALASSISSEQNENEVLHPAKEVEADAPIAVDDLDAAMAWIEEFAASQDAPIEEVPSVADRALASKLMMEAGLPPVVSPLDELGSDSSHVEGMTPTHPFIEEEDYADTVVLVETLAADQEANLDTSESEVEHEDGTPAFPEPLLDVPLPIAVAIGAEIAEGDTSDELSFEEAMALLDEMATEQLPDETESITSFDQVSTHDISDDEQSISADDSSFDDIPELETDPTFDFEPTGSEPDPWMTESDTYMASPTVNEESLALPVAGPALASNGIGYGDLESTLLGLDALALPPGKSLDEIDARLRAAQTTAWRDVQSALDWLESSLAGEKARPSASSIDVDDTELIARMPEDPDAVLAWLEGMAAEEESRISSPAVTNAETVDVLPSTLQPGPLVEDLVEADLLNMPDDPDEAMAWLESLARESRPPDETPSQVDIRPHDSHHIDEADRAIPEVEPAPPISSAANIVIDDEAPDAASEFVDESVEPVTEDLSGVPPTGDFSKNLLSDIEEFGHKITEPDPAHADQAGTESSFDGDAETEIFVPPPVEREQEPASLDTAVTEPKPKSGRRSSRAKPADDLPSAESTIPDAETEQLKDEISVEDDKSVAEKPAEGKPRIPSWIDLLKPLD